MSKGIAGYGRYNDDPSHVGCPRAKSDMTPCIARDGRVCIADDRTCVGCGAKPHDLLKELRDEGVAIPQSIDVWTAADALQTAVREVTKGLVP
jgi:hypothetical protein